MKIAIQREQNQASLSYDERERFIQRGKTHLAQGIALGVNNATKTTALKIAIKREQTKTCFQYAERKRFI